MSKAHVSLDDARAPFVLALDIGSSSVRALVFDRLAYRIASLGARRELTLHTDADGTVVVDADRLLDKIVACLDDIVAQVTKYDLRIAAVGGCMFVGNVLGIDNTGRAVTPVFTYADSRPARDADTLRLMLDEAYWHQQVGTLFHPSYLPARFMWLQRTQPQLFERVSRWVSIAEYLWIKLFGEAYISHSAASWTGLLNRFHLDWDDDLLANLPISRTHLSAVEDYTKAVSGLLPEFAERWPVLRDIPWFPLFGDGATANIGSGCVSLQRVAITMGTSSAVRVVYPGNIHRIPAGLWSYRVDSESSLVGGALSEGGGVYQWLLNTLRFAKDAMPQLEVEQVPPDAHGLTFLPLLAGERSPGWRGDARGALVGLSLGTTPAQILRAAMEGVAYRIGIIYRLLEPFLPRDAIVVGNGGALLNSPLWTQMIADVLGCRLYLSDVEEASARGAAMMVLLAMGKMSDLSGFPDLLGVSFVPDGHRHQIYLRAAQRQQALYQNLYENHE